MSDLSIEDAVRNAVHTIQLFTDDNSAISRALRTIADGISPRDVVTKAGRVPREWGSGDEVPLDVDAVHEVGGGFNWFRLYGRTMDHETGELAGPYEPVPCWTTEVGDAYTTAVHVREGISRGNGKGSLVTSPLRGKDPDADKKKIEGDPKVVEEILKALQQARTALECAVNGKRDRKLFESAESACRSALADLAWLVDATPASGASGE